MKIGVLEHAESVSMIHSRPTSSLRCTLSNKIFEVLKNFRIVFNIDVPQ